MELQRNIFDPPFRLVDTLILASLSRHPNHGYDLEAHVRNISAGIVITGTSSVYKALKRLEAEGHVKQLGGDAGERRRYFDITQEGRSQLGRDLVLLRGVVKAFDHRL